MNLVSPVQFTVHLSHGLHEIVRVLEADKAVALGLLCLSFSDHLCLQEGGVLGEGSCQGVIIHVITNVTHKDPEIIWDKKADISLVGGCSSYTVGPVSIA